MLHTDHVICIVESVVIWEQEDQIPSPVVASWLSK